MMPPFLKPRRKTAAQKNPDEVFRAFLRVLASLAPRNQGGAPVASGALREKS